MLRSKQSLTGQYLSGKKSIPVPKVRRPLGNEKLVVSMIAAPVASWACDGAGPATHIGKVSAVDAAAKKFTIKDVQSQGPITFKATDEIIKGLKEAKGMVTVKYHEQDGALTALGVTF